MIEEGRARSGPSPSSALLLAPLFLPLSHFPHRKARKGGGEEEERREKARFFGRELVNGGRIRRPFLGFSVSLLLFLSSWFSGWLLGFVAFEFRGTPLRIFLFSFFQYELLWLLLLLLLLLGRLACWFFSWVWLSWAFCDFIDFSRISAVWSGFWCVPVLSWKMLAVGFAADVF